MRTVLRDARIANDMWPGCGLIWFVAKIEKRLKPFFFLKNSYAKYTYFFFFWVNYWYYDHVVRFLLWVFARNRTELPLSEKAFQDLWQRRRRRCQQNGADVDAVDAVVVAFFRVAVHPVCALICHLRDCLHYFRCTHTHTAIEHSSVCVCVTVRGALFRVYF